MKRRLFRWSGALIICSIIGMSFSVLPAQAETDAERRTRLEQELQVVERQILTQQRLVEDTQAQRQTLERDVTLIDGQVKKAQLGIKAREIAITQLTGQIGEKEEVIQILGEQVNRQRLSLADLVRKSAAINDFSLVEVLLSKKSFSDFFSEFAQYAAIKSALNHSIAALHEMRQDNYEQKNTLASKQQTEAEMKQAQELVKKEIEAKEKEKTHILTATKGQEAEYQRLLKSQQQTAAQLRNALFQLLGGGGGISLPQAIAYAEFASKQTGVDTPMILGILEQETNLGANLGSCAYNDVRGDRPVMHPDRDQPIFLAIAQILGFDARSRSVSCPITSGGQRVGWGGAMGPSQFIPSTWAIYGGIVSNGAGGYMYSASSDAIRTLNGGTPGNPFNNQDAFIATALLLRDNGANGTYAGDRLAALRYYAGWGGATNPANAFYGDGVMNRKAKFEAQIKILGGG